MNSELHAEWIPVQNSDLLTFRACCKGKLFTEGEIHSAPVKPKYLGSRRLNQLPLKSIERLLLIFIGVESGPVYSNGGGEIHPARRRTAALLMTAIPTYTMEQQPHPQCKICNPFPCLPSPCLKCGLSCRANTESFAMAGRAHGWSFVQQNSQRRA